MTAPFQVDVLCAQIAELAIAQLAAVFEELAGARLAFILKKQPNDLIIR
jgi:hypothetical protein